MKQLLKIVIIAILVSVTVTVTLKLLDHDNPVVIGGGVSGGVIGALSVLLLNNKKKN